MSNSVGHPKIETIQDFVDAVGDKGNLWKLIQGKEVSRFTEQVKYEILHRSSYKVAVSGIEFHACGRVCSIQGSARHTLFV